MNSTRFALFTVSFTAFSRFACGAPSDSETHRPTEHLAVAPIDVRVSNGTLLITAGTTLLSYPADRFTAEVAVGTPQATTQRELRHGTRIVAAAAAPNAPVVAVAVQMGVNPDFSEDFVFFLDIAKSTSTKVAIQSVRGAATAADGAPTAFRELVTIAYPRGGEALKVTTSTSAGCDATYSLESAGVRRVSHSCE
jgi:hypothetical protein